MSVKIVIANESEEETSRIQLAIKAMLADKGFSTFHYNSLVPGQIALEFHNPAETEVDRQRMEHSCRNSLAGALPAGFAKGIIG